MFTLDGCKVDTLRRSTFLRFSLCNFLTAMSNDSRGVTIINSVTSPRSTGRTNPSNAMSCLPSSHIRAIRTRVSDIHHREARETILSHNLVKLHAGCCRHESKGHNRTSHLMHVRDFKDPHWLVNSTALFSAH